MSQQTKHFYEFGHFRLDPDEHLLLYEGQLVPLPPKVFDTLVVLVERSGHVVDKDELMKLVWQDTFVEEVNLAKNVWALRKALGERQKEESYIETIPKRGYRFVAQVRASREDENGLGSGQLLAAGSVIGEEKEIQVEELRAGDGLGPGEMANGNGESVNQAGPVPARTQRIDPFSVIYRHRRIAAFLLAALLLGAAGTIYTNWGAGAIDSLAILPLTNANADPEVEYLSDGITEALISNLSRLPQLKRVIARSTMASYKGKTVDPLEAGQALGVRAVLTGKLVQHGDDLIIAAELVNVADGSRLWGEQYQRKFADIQTVQAELSRDIAEKLRLRLSGEEKLKLGNRYKANIEAYQLYFKGRYFLNRAGRDDLLKAIEFFLQAIGKDPLYAPAYAGMAEAYNSLGINGIYPQKEAFTKAAAAAKRALELDDDLAEAHAALAHFSMSTWDWPAADREFKRAIELNPNYERAHDRYAVYLSLLGPERKEEAIAKAERAMELDPFSLSVSASAAYVYIRTRQYDQAIDQSRKTVGADPKHQIGLGPLMMAYELKGMYEEAIRARTDPAVAAAFKAAYTAAGSKGYWKEALDRTLERVKQGQPVRPYHLGVLYAQLGEKDRAFEMIQKGYEQHDWDLGLLKSDPRLDSLRSDARYTDMLRQLGFPP